MFSVNPAYLNKEIRQINLVNFLKCNFYRVITDARLTSINPAKHVIQTRTAPERPVRCNDNNSALNMRLDKGLFQKPL